MQKILPYTFLSLGFALTFGTCQAEALTASDWQRERAFPANSWRSRPSALMLIAEQEVPSSDRVHRIHGTAHRSAASLSARVRIMVAASRAASAYSASPARGATGCRAAQNATTASTPSPASTSISSR